MLRVNVGLNRKLTRDYNSTGFSLNLEGELAVALDDPETLIEKIKEFYDLAEEALNQQVERYESESAIGSRDEEPAPPKNGRPKNRVAKPSNGHTAVQPPEPVQPPATNGANHSAPSEAATNKQVQYLLNLGKRHGLTPTQLEARVGTILGKQVTVYDLTKREAGDVIDELSQNGTPVTNGAGRSRVTR